MVSFDTEGDMFMEADLDVHLTKYRAQFDSEYKTAAVAQFMEQNLATFESATAALGYAHGVDFLLFVDGDE